MLETDLKVGTGQETGGACLATGGAGLREGWEGLEDNGAVIGTSLDFFFAPVSS